MIKPLTQTTLVLVTCLLTACSQTVDAKPTATACITFTQNNQPLLQPIDSQVINEQDNSIVHTDTRHTYCIRDLPLGNYAVIIKEHGKIRFSRLFHLRSNGIHLVINARRPLQ